MRDLLSVVLNDFGEPGDAWGSRAALEVRACGRLRALQLKLVPLIERRCALQLQGTGAQQPAAAACRRLPLLTCSRLLARLQATAT